MNQTDFSLQNTLISMGFSDKEAIVYIASLELGKGTVSQISRKAGVNRTTSYHILGSLVNRGLIIISGKEPRQEYSAESPDKIITMFDQYIHANQAYIKQAKELIPNLKCAVTSAPHRPRPPAPAASGFPRCRQKNTTTSRRLRKVTPQAPSANDVTTNALHRPKALATHWSHRCKHSTPVFRNLPPHQARDYRISAGRCETIRCRIWCFWRWKRGR